LDQTRYDLSPDITILGCTLFSNILPSQSDSVGFGLNDFYHIENWTVEHHSEVHIADLDWLNAQVKSIAALESRRKTIILTHLSPTISPKTVDPAHAQSKLSSGFSSDLSNEVCWASQNFKCEPLVIRISIAISWTPLLGKEFLPIKGDTASVIQQDLMRERSLRLEGRF
jgi:hypothetical protein